jgi:hypothetical protein
MQPSQPGTAEETAEKPHTEAITVSDDGWPGLRAGLERPGGQMEEAETPDSDTEAKPHAEAALDVEARANTPNTPTEEDVIRAKAIRNGVPASRIESVVDYALRFRKREKPLFED